MPQRARVVTGVYAKRHTLQGSETMFNIWIFPCKTESRPRGLCLYDVHTMPTPAKVRPGDLERRESQLTVFACVAIGLLAVGTALFMYPVVSSSADKTLPIAF